MSVAGGYRLAFAQVLSPFWLVGFPLASKRFISGSCGLSVPFQSSLFRGLFLSNPRLEKKLSKPRIFNLTEVQELYVLPRLIVEYRNWIGKQNDRDNFDPT